MAGALLLGFVTGGLIEGVAECALWSLCDFGEAILTSEIDAALTLRSATATTSENRQECTTIIWIRFDSIRINDEDE